MSCLVNGKSRATLPTDLGIRGSSPVSMGDLSTLRTMTRISLVGMEVGAESLRLVI